MGDARSLSKAAGSLSHNPRQAPESEGRLFHCAGRFAPGKCPDPADTKSATPRRMGETRCTVSFLFSFCFYYRVQNRHSDLASVEAEPGARGSSGQHMAESSQGRKKRYVGNRARILHGPTDAHHPDCAMVFRYYAREVFNDLPSACVRDQHLDSASMVQPIRHVVLSGPLAGTQLGN